VKSLALSFSLIAFGLVGVAGFASEPTTSAPASQPLVREAHEGPVKLSITLDKDRLGLSDQITMKLRIEAEGGLQLQVPQFKDVLGDFLIKGIPPATSQQSDVAGTYEQTYVLAPALPGAASIPAIEIKYKDARERADGSTGSNEGSVKVEEIKVAVVANLADVKGPATLPWGGLEPIWWWIIGVVGGTLVVAIVAHWLHRRKAGAGAIQSIVIDPPHIWAIKQLEKLLGLGLVERGEVQEFYYRINSLVREYIERRFGLMAHEQTSEEFIRSTQHSSLLAPGHKLMLRQFVDACDPVKYARQRPDVEDIQWVQGAARQFFVETAQASDQSIVRDPQSAIEAGAAA
jgi:hypothetical protein